MLVTAANRNVFRKESPLVTSWLWFFGLLRMCTFLETYLCLPNLSKVFYQSVFEAGATTEELLKSSMHQRCLCFTSLVGFLLFTLFCFFPFINLSLFHYDLVSQCQFAAAQIQARCKKEDQVTLLLPQASCMHLFEIRKLSV